MLWLGLGDPGAKYFRELEKKAPFLQELNNQFRHICSGMELISFYESLQTTIVDKVIKVKIFNYLSLFMFNCL